MDSLEETKFKTTQLISKVNNLIRWFKSHNEHPPDKYALEQETMFGVEKLVLENAKVVLNVDEIPKELWKPFAYDFIKPNSSSNYKTESEKWEYYEKLLKETL